MDKKKILGIALAVTLAISLPSLVIGAYILTSNHLTGNTNSQANLALTGNGTTITTGYTIGDVLLLTAHLNDSKSGVVVTFYNGTTALSPNVTTDSSGSANVYYTLAEHFDLYATATHP